MAEGPEEEECASASRGENRAQDQMKLLNINHVLSLREVGLKVQSIMSLIYCQIFEISCTVGVYSNAVVPYDLFMRLSC